MPGYTAERQRWKWHHDPAYRASKERTNRCTKIKTQIRRHINEIQRLEAELLRLQN
jgi:ribosomal 50S subunit-associated protein YjgA (DUF615 family)